MYRHVRRSLPGYENITITRRRFSQIVKALAGSRPKAPLSGYWGFGWSHTATLKREKINKMGFYMSIVSQERLSIK